MPRILLLAQFYPPIIGGEERHVRNLGQALAARGHDVCVATLRHDDLPATEWDGPVRVVRVRGTAQKARMLFTDPGHAHAPPCPDPGIASALQALTQAYRPHLAHAHNWMGHSFAPVRTAGGPPLLMTLHDYGLACAKKSLMRDGTTCEGPGLVRCLRCAGDHYGALKGALTVSAHRMANPKRRHGPDAYLAVSHAVAIGNGLEEAGLDYEVVPNFVPDSVGSLPDVDDRRLGLLPEGPFILFVGDVRGIKGAQVLLDAYAVMENPPPLVLIGRRCSDGPTKLPANVIALEEWSHDLVMHAWSRAALGVAPSIWPEPCATVVLEGMAMGKPMVVTDVGGMPDMVDHGVTGLVVPPGDAAALAQAMTTLVEDPSLRRRMGVAARRKLESFKASQVVPRIEDAYARLLAA